MKVTCLRKADQEMKPGPQRETKYPSTKTGYGLAPPELDQWRREARAS